MTQTLGNLRPVYEQQRDWRIGQIAGYSEINPLMAQISAGFPPAWYALQIVSGQERIAAAHLVARRFGIFLPETEERRSRRGKLIAVARPMFPGYLFLFTWLEGRNYRRAISCPGVLDFLRAGANVAVVPDRVIDGVRAEENRQRPLVVNNTAIAWFRKGRRGFRRFRKMIQQGQRIEDSQIVGVHTWSALSDGLRDLDGDGRNRLLLAALGVA